MRLVNKKSGLFFGAAALLYAGMSIGVMVQTELDYRRAARSVRKHVEALASDG